MATLLTTIALLGLSLSVHAKSTEGRYCSQIQKEIEQKHFDSKDEDIRSAVKNLIKAMSPLDQSRYEQLEKQFWSHRNESIRLDGYTTGLTPPAGLDPEVEIAKANAAAKKTQEQALRLLANSFVSGSQFFKIKEDLRKQSIKVVSDRKNLSFHYSLPGSKDLEIGAKRIMEFVPFESMETSVGLEFNKRSVSLSTWTYLRLQIPECKDTHEVKEAQNLGPELIKHIQDLGKEYSLPARTKPREQRTRVN